MIKIVDYKDKRHKRELLGFQDNVFSDFNQLLKELSDSHYKKSALVTYWLNDYKNYLYSEESFSPRELVKYSRGAIIKVNLGFNLGNEQGGLHYCVVLNKKDTINIPLLNVIPLSSIKDPNKKIHYTNVNLGSELYENLNSKLIEKTKTTETYLVNIEYMNDIIYDLLKVLESIQSEDKDIEHKRSLDNKPVVDELIKKFNEILNNVSWDDEYIHSLIKIITDINIDLINNFESLFGVIKKYHEIVRGIIPIIKIQVANNNKILREINRMKNGSIAHIDQITTISKMRIYNPKSTEDALYNIKLSNESLTLIDNKIKELFTY